MQVFNFIHKNEKDPDNSIPVESASEDAARSRLEDKLLELSAEDGQFRDIDDYELLD